MNVLVFSLSISFFLFLSWIMCPEKLSFGFLLLNYLMFVTVMPCLYVLLCGPKIRNKDSYILYLGLARPFSLLFPCLIQKRRN